MRQILMKENQRLNHGLQLIESNIFVNERSSSSDDASGSEDESDKDSEEFSEEDHTYLVTSVANLRRRELMKLNPMRTRSKVAPLIKERKQYNWMGCWNIGT